MAIHQIPVIKAGKRPIEIDTSSLSDEAYLAIVAEGLKHFINLGTSKLKQEDYATLDAFETAAFEIAEKQKAKILSGDIRKRAAPKTKVAGVEMTEALRLAKISAREQYKVMAATDKTMPRISHILAKQWTETAKAMIASDPDMWLQAARESLARATEGPKVPSELFSHLTADPKKVEAAKKKAAKDKAGKTAAPPPPAKGKGKGKGNPAHGA